MKLLIGVLCCEYATFNLNLKLLLINEYCVDFRYKKEGRFLGKDQSIMATSCIESNLCLMIPAPDILDKLWRPIDKE
jgi:hypothetical protein